MTNALARARVSKRAYEMLSESGRSGYRGRAVPLGVYFAEVDAVVWPQVS